MAYCKKCGAYIPDNQMTCLACGFDESEAAAQALKEENERLAAEERRRKQQEYDRKWAQNEYANRQRRQQENDKWAEAEAVRRRREEEARRRWEDEKARRAAMENENRSYKSNEVSDAVRHIAEGARDTIREAKNGKGAGRLMSVLAYFDILFLVPMFLAKDDPAAQFHAKQGLRLFIFNAITTALTAMFPIAGLLKLLGLYCFIKGVGNALNDKTVPLPYIGDFKL